MAPMLVFLRQSVLFLVGISLAHAATVVRPCTPGWQERGGFCYQLSSETYSSKTDAAQKCASLSPFAALINVTNQRVLNDAREVIGARANLTEVWTKDCLKKNKPCSVLSNWDNLNSNKFNCFDKVCRLQNTKALALCQKGTNQCAKKPCLNGGSCMETSGGYKCQCTEMFSGNQCETELACPATWTMNRDVCYKKLPRIYKLKSQAATACLESSYGGTLALVTSQQILVDITKLIGVLNNFTEFWVEKCLGKATPKKPCVTLSNWKFIGKLNLTCYEKVCTLTGKPASAICQKPLNKCYNGPCKNNGTCINLGDGTYDCRCRDGFIGQNCQEGPVGNICPSSWKHRADSCYNLTPSRYSSQQDAAAWCRNQLSVATLANVTTEEIRRDVSDVIGPSNVEKEVWVNRCLNANGAGCAVLSNEQHINEAHYQCLSRSCTNQSPKEGLCQSEKDTANQCGPQPCKNGGTCTDGYLTYGCVCLPGYTGTNCEAEVDECSSQPCRNGGTCRDQPNGFQCQCLRGFTGSLCETNINECSSDPCQNGAPCEDLVNGYKCKCQAGYTGQNCQTDINECDSSPCKNGGTCMDGINGYTCRCVAGFSGGNCENNIDECYSRPCLHGGKCTDLVNGFKCECQPGYTGPVCETDIDDCASQPCRNGANCTDVVNGYMCSCKAGYSGVNCETDIDECSSGPCQNGATCTDRVNSYTCSCINGFTGTNCETNIDECKSKPCQNGGNCKDGINTFVCQCQAGFTGTLCETNINECSSAPCRNGATCQDQVNSYVCLCRPGFTGTNCQTDIDDCFSRPCRNGATCTDNVNGFRCTCIPGYTGQTCETDIDECASQPCQNSGKCTDIVNGFQCKCKTGYTGILCESSINECDSNPCQNGGECGDQVGGYVCGCKPGFTGKQCQTNINECSSNPCVHGSCVDLVNDYRCRCMPGYTGRQCETDIDECASKPCQNDGKCVDRPNGYICSCPPTSTGRNCENVIGACASQPCQNGGTCVVQSDGYTCQCPPNKIGKNCEKVPFKNYAVLVVAVIVPIIVVVAVIIAIMVICKKRKIKYGARYMDEKPTAFANDMNYGDRKYDDASEKQPTFFQLSPIVNANNSNSSGLPDDVSKPASTSHPIKVDRLAAELNDMISSGEMSKEFKGLPTSLSAQCEAGKSIENQSKNRMLEIYPYDHSRVMLDYVGNDPSSDYINAVYIHGFRAPGKYIATQGPKKNTVGDFWRMVWKEKCHRIVMLTNVEENGKIKCETYWPEREPLHIAGMKIEKTSERQLCNYTQRTFTLSKNNDRRSITQFHFTSWPQHSTPSTIDLLCFRKRVNSAALETPLVVHCSKGIGRTGAFVAIDYLVTQSLAEGEIDVLKCALDMRGSMCRMIQTEELYRFVYDAVADYVSAGDTSIPTPQFSNRYQLMKGSEQLLKWFENLNKLSRRDIQVMKSRPVCIDSYTRMNAFMPLKAPSHTNQAVVQFWKAIYDNNSYAIVLLEDLSGPSEQYWPEERTKEDYGALQVECVSVSHDNSSGAITREFRILNRLKQGECRWVRQFESMFWPRTSRYPAPKSALRSLIAATENWNQQTGNGPITVVDRDGESRSGIYCAVSYIWETMQIDQQVDVFTTIRKLRTQRPGFITNMEDYRFCHDMVLEYLEVSDA